MIQVNRWQENRDAVNFTMGSTWHKLRKEKGARKALFPILSKLTSLRDVRPYGGSTEQERGG